VPSALTRVQIALQKVELVRQSVMMSMIRQLELVAHLEQKSALPAHCFQADLPLDFDLQRECC
jgi:hypothetical protein